jgi:hypothetical protein
MAVPAGGMLLLGSRPRVQDRGQSDLLSDPSARDLRSDGAERDLLGDRGIQDRLRDQGVQETILLGPLLRGEPPAELRVGISSARAGRFAVSFRRE